MSNEKANEFLAWRGKLAGPEALPEQGLEDKELSWQRLAERLQRQPRRRVAWWIAAACLILAFFFPVTHHFRSRAMRSTPLANRGVAPAKRQETAKRVAANGATAANKATAMHSDRPVRSAFVQSDPHSLPGPRVASTKGVPATTSGAATAAGTMPATTTGGPTTSGTATAGTTPAAVPAPKHQLRVVCYNEISAPAAPPPQKALRETAFRRIAWGRLPEPGAGDWLAAADAAPFLTITLMPKTN